MKLTTLIASFSLATALLVVAADDKAKKETAKPYPLKTCIVSDEPLGGDHGEPFVFVHEGQEFKLCCEPCLPKFKKDPKSFQKKLTKAAKTGDKAK